jgi:hypothetical protein
MSINLHAYMGICQGHFYSPPPLPRDHALKGPSSTPSAPKPSRREQWGAVADCLRFEKESFGALHTILDGLDQAGKDATWAESDPRFESSTLPTDLKDRAS